MKHKFKAWEITQEQIRNRDVDGAIISVDPEQIADKQIKALHGRVRLRVEGTRGPSDIFMDPQVRRFFRAVYERWPWQAYFLRLTPINENSPQPQIVDLSLFMALALCHCDQLTYCETNNGVGLRYNPGQLGKILVDMLGRASELSQCVGVSPATIKIRETLVTNSVISFFDAGKNLTKQLNQNRKRK
jgi:hypothetical protein